MIWFYGIAGTLTGACVIGGCWLTFLTWRMTRASELLRVPTHLLTPRQRRFLERYIKRDVAYQDHLRASKRKQA